MKGTIFLSFLILFFFLGYFSGKSAPLTLKQDIGGEDKIIQTGAIISGITLPLTTDILLSLGSEYLNTKVVSEQFENDIKGQEIMGKIDKLIQALPLKKEYQQLLNIPYLERKSWLEKNMRSLDKESMAYATVSDALYGTNLCDNHTLDSSQCLDQYAVILKLLDSLPIALNDIDFSSPKLVSTYAYQEGLSESQYKQLIQDLLRRYLN